jgi:hypothetical protein
MAGARSLSFSKYNDRTGSIAIAKLRPLRNSARMPRLSIRVDLPDVGSIGPGKIRLLELVADTGSIRQAGLALEMSYARAWGLVRELNEMFGEPVVEASAGGKAGVAQASRNSVAGLSTSTAPSSARPVRPHAKNAPR